MLGCVRIDTPTATLTKDAPAQDIAVAKRLLAESGYDGAPVVILDPTDNSVLHAATQVVAKQMLHGGWTVDVQSMDWATAIARRSKTGPAKEGGWNIFLTSLSGPPITSPLTNQPSFHLVGRHGMAGHAMKELRCCARPGPQLPLRLQGSQF